MLALVQEDQNVSRKEFGQFQGKYHWFLKEIHHSDLEIDIEKQGHSREVRRRPKYFKLKINERGFAVWIRLIIGWYFYFHNNVLN